MSITIHPEATAQLRGAMQRILAEIAFRVEAEAKATAPVDTGFLQTTIQAIPPGQAGAEARMEPHDGRVYEAPATRGARDDEALVVCHAAYAYWVERQTPFLLPAAQAVAAELDAMVQRHTV